MSSHTNLDRSADALLQHKAMQTSRHEHLQESHTRLSRSVKHAYQQARDAVGDVQRLQEDLRDIEQETISVDEALTSHHQLRLSMLLAMRAQTSVAFLSQRLDDATSAWSDVPNRFVMLFNDSCDFEHAHVRLSDAATHAVAACSTCRDALSILHTVNKLNWAHQVLNQDCDLPRQLQEILNTTNAEILQQGTEMDLAEAQGQSFHQRLQEMHEKIDSLEVQHAEYEAYLQATLAAKTTVEPQVAESSKMLEERRLQKQMMTEALHVGREIRVPLTESVVSGFLDTSTAEAEVLTLLPQKAQSELTEARRANASGNQSIVAAETSLEERTSKTGAAELLVVVPHTQNHTIWRGWSEKITSLRVTIKTRHTAKDAFVTFEESVQATSLEVSQVQEKRHACLAAVQRAMTNLSLEEMPRIRSETIEKEEDQWSALQEQQLHEMTLVIEQCAMRQQKDATEKRAQALKLEADEKARVQASRNAAAAAAASAVAPSTSAKASTRETQLMASRHKLQAHPTPGDVPEVLHPPPRPTMPHKGPLQPADRSAVVATPAVTTFATSTTGGGRILRRRQESVALSAWSIEEAQFGAHNGRAGASQLKTASKIERTTSGNGGAAKSQSAATPSPQPRIPPTRRLASGGSIFAKKASAAAPKDQLQPAHGAVVSTAFAKKVQQQSQQGLSSQVNTGGCQPPAGRMMLPRTVAPVRRETNAPDDFDVFAI